MPKNILNKKEEDYLQEEIIINDVKIPIIKDGEVIYYPISYIGSKVLLKILTGNQLIKNGYSEYIKEFEVNYGEDTGGLQNTYCISEDGLRVILKNSKIGRLKVEQKRAMKGLCEYLGIEIDVDFNAKFKDNITEEELESHDFWSKECINIFVENNNNIIWQKCNQCGKYYPYHENFWVKETNKNNKQPLRAVCNKCKNLHINYFNNKEYTKAYYEGGEILYNIYKSGNKNIYEIYNLYIEGKFEYPSILKNSLNTNNIIIKLYKDKILENIDKCTQEYISEITKIPINYISMKALDRHLFQKIKKEELLKTNLENEMPKERKSRVYSKKIIKRMTFEDAKYLIDTYVQNNNIIIDVNNVYTYNYDELFKSSKTYWYVINIHKDKLGFIMKYFDNQYAAYKFKSVTGQKYWKDKDNVDLAMRHFIEQDIKVPIEKIPLYVTKMNLQMKARILCHFIREKRFDNSLFEWIDRLYPGRFIEEDFAIGIIRNEFDSMEEKMVHDMLKSKFKNVVYNNRNSDNKVNIMGMMPDWFIFTDNNIYLVEYFGIEKDQKKYNKKITYYIEKTERKLEKYKILPYAEKIYLYPSDIKDDCKGFNEKIKMIV